MTVLIPSRDSIFLHIPKTGGMALSEALVEAVPDAVWLDSHFWQHADVVMVRNLFMRPLQTFTIIRDPREIFRSRYSWLKTMAEHPEQLQPEWFRQAVLSDANLSFDQMCVQSVKMFCLEPGCGFLHRYCSSRTIVFRYEDNPYDMIGEMLHCKLNLPKRNVSHHPKPEMTRDALELINAYTDDDRDRAGYALVNTPQQ